MLMMLTGEAAMMRWSSILMIIERASCLMNVMDDDMMKKAIRYGLSDDGTAYKLSDALMNEDLVRVFCGYRLATRKLLWIAQM
jgi:hypothetical protein